MPTWMSLPARCIVLVLAAAPVATSAGIADPRAAGADRDQVLAQQQTDPGLRTDPSLHQWYGEIRELRDEIAAIYDGPNETEALPLLARELAVGEKVIRAARKGATDGQMHALIQYLEAEGDLLFSIIARHPSDARLVTLGLSYTTARRARFAREQFQEFSTWKISVEQDQPALWQSLRQAQDRFTDLSVLPSFTGNPRMDLIQQQADTIGDLEKSIFESGALRRMFSVESTSDIFVAMGVDQLVANVNFGKVLVVYIVYKEVRRSPKTGALEQGPARYMAIVGHAGAPLAAVDLGPAAAVDDLEKAFLASLENPPENNAPFDRAPAEQLFKKIVAPLSQHFTYSNVNYKPSLLISPDGALLCIPFAALVDDGTFLIDKYQLALLNSPEEANLISRTNLIPETRFLALSNPTLPIVVRSKLGPLKEADREADQIAALWPQGQQLILNQSHATPEALTANATAAGILHIASHGVFAASVLGPMKPQILSQGNIASDKTGLMASSLARSAIILAPPSSKPDATGFFSALDVLGLDLSHTQLVVLAACDSGIGDQERGEGIYGLRRSFLEAGTETVVSSLWSVDSAGTREMMVSFYRNLFQGQARGDALQHAAAFTRLKYPHPHYWAAFVIIGNLGGLRLPSDN